MRCCASLLTFPTLTSPEDADTSGGFHHLGEQRPLDRTPSHTHTYTRSQLERQMSLLFPCLLLCWWECASRRCSRAPTRSSPVPRRRYGSSPVMDSQNIVDILFFGVRSGSEDIFFESFFHAIPNFVVEVRRDDSPLPEEHYLRYLSHAHILHLNVFNFSLSSFSFLIHLLKGERWSALMTLAC